MIDSWRSAWTGAPADKASRLFGIATLAAGGSEGAGTHMAGLRWSQTGNYGVWPNPRMPNTFGAQLYDLGDPWSNAGDGNRPVINQSSGQPSQPITRSCCLAPQKAFNWTGDGPGCPNVNATEPFMRKACYDKFGCALPDPITGKYGPLCATFDAGDWPQEMRAVAKLVQQNAPSGEPGTNFMGGIHPRFKRFVGRRLAYAAARQLKRQQRERRGGAGGQDGALTGPTISGCTSTSPGQLVLNFNSSLLGGEGLELRAFDANETGGWGDPSNKHPTDRPVTDSNGAMVCTLDPGCTPRPGSPCGNATTCQCQTWNYIKMGTCVPGNCRMQAFWFCEVGPGWKPSAGEMAALTAQRVAEHARRTDAGLGLPSPEPRLGWVPSPNPFLAHWHPAPLKQATATSVAVDLAGLGIAGRAPIAIRYAWPLLGRGASDTCCPTASVQNGRGACIPGNCPLYSGTSGLPANPFFATIQGGKCRCAAPQDCSA